MAGGEYSAIFIMIKHRKINQRTHFFLKTTEEYTGESLEDKVRRTMEAGTPVEAISPMVYTERKEGVRPETNIRTDRFEIAQNAMGTIADGIRTKRTERMTTDTATPDVGSK